MPTNKKKVAKSKTWHTKLSPETVAVIETTILHYPWGTHENLRRDAVFRQNVLRSADVLLNGRVREAHISLFDRTPVIRVTISYDGAKVVLNKSNPLQQLLARFAIVGNMSPTFEKFCEEIFKVLPQEELAMQMADIENVSAQALQDPKKLEPIRERINKRRVADKERLTAKVREVFRGHDNLISEEEILAMWRETMCAEVMDS